MSALPLPCLAFPLSCTKFSNEFNKKNNFLYDTGEEMQATEAYMKLYGSYDPNKNNNRSSNSGIALAITLSPLIL